MGQSRRADMPKIIVAIPTRNRPVQYLRATILSVARQAMEHGHDLEIVISDLSHRPEIKRNSRTIVSLKTKLGDRVPIHYYPAKRNSEIDRLLSGATEDEQEAFRQLVPEDGFWGANRNRLALLSAYHGGPNAVYLHLDDDTPLLALKNTPREATIKKLGRDEISLFLAGLGRALARGNKGYASVIRGVVAGVVSGGSGPQKVPNLRRQLLKGVRTYGGEFKGGAGRILSFDAMKWPYHPYELGETNLQQDRFGKLDYDAPNSDGAPQVLHIGAAGWAPSGKGKLVFPEELMDTWAGLVEKMASLKKARGSAKQRKTKQ